MSMYPPPPINATQEMKATSNGAFQGDNPLDFALPLLILQICLVVAFTRGIAYALKPLRQPRVIAEIIVVVPSTVYTQPWWQGSGNTSSVEESTLQSTSGEHLNGSLTAGAVQPQANSGSDSGPDGSKEQEGHPKHIPSSTPVSMGGSLEPHSQMELAGHSIVLTSNPYTDPQYGGMLTAYGPQAMMTPPFYGYPHVRMPLPLEMEEEPVYVNAKQFHGILRRRQARAKAELERKAIKARKPYLHESRHLHALRRARGCGGRFANTKKLDNNSTSHTSDKERANGALDSSMSGDRREGKGSSAQDTRTHSSSNASGNDHGMSSMYHSSAGDRGFFDQQRESMHGNRVLNTAHSSH